MASVGQINLSVGKFITLWQRRVDACLAAAEKAHQEQSIEEVAKPAGEAVQGDHLAVEAEFETLVTEESFDNDADEADKTIVTEKLQKT